MIIAPNSYVHQKEGAHGEEENEVVDWYLRNSDATRGRSLTNSVRGIGCEEQEKTSDRIIHDHSNNSIELNEF